MLLCGVERLFIARSLYTFFFNKTSCLTDTDMFYYQKYFVLAMMTLVHGCMVVGGISIITRPGFRLS